MPRLSLLARFGRAFLSSMILSWWTDWRNRSPVDPIEAELKGAIASAESAYTPLGPLAEWMTSYGWDGTGQGGWLLGSGVISGTVRKGEAKLAGCGRGNLGRVLPGPR